MACSEIWGISDVGSQRALHLTAEWPRLFPCLPRQHPSQHKLDAPLDFERRCSLICITIAHNAKTVSLCGWLGSDQSLYSSLKSNALHWHNEHDGIPNHWCLHCLLNCWFRRKSKKTSKLRVTGLCEGNSPVTVYFPAQKANNVENVSIWRHYVDAIMCIYIYISCVLLTPMCTLK